MARPKSLRTCLPRSWRVFLHLAPRLREHYGLIAGSSVALLAGIVLQILEPWPLKFVIDSVLTSDRHSGSHRLAIADGMNVDRLLLLCAVAVIAIGVLRAVSAYCRSVGFALIGNRVLTQVRHDLFRHLQGLSLSFHDKARHGDLIVRVTGDINMLKDVTVSSVLPMAVSLLTLVGMIGVMFWMQWQLTLLVMLVLPVFWVATLRLSRKIHESARQQRHREGAMAATASEGLASAKVEKALSLESDFERKFSSRNSKSLKEGVKTSRLTAKLEGTVDVLATIATAIVLYFGARLVLGGRLSPGELIVFLTYLKRASKPLQDFAKYTGRLSKATAAGERVVELLQTTNDVAESPDAVPAPALRGEIRFESIRFRYEPEKPVIDGIDLSISPGMSVALVGESGIGKSTLLSLLLRLYDPDEGRVSIDGHDLRRLTLSSFRSQISVVLQETMLFAASVQDNIAAGLVDVTREECIAAAKLANAHEFIRALPQGYDTVLGERGVTLSHGQRQRLSVARAAIRRTPILLLDEPTAGLDEANARAVIEALQNISTGRTTLTVTHDLRLASYADVVLYLADGRILEQGTHAELMRRNGRYAHSYRMQTLHNGREVVESTSLGEMQHVAAS